MKICLREMNKSDHEAVLAMAQTLAAWWQPIDQMTLAIDLREHIGVVAENESGKPVGFLTYRLEKPRIAELTWLGVRADARSQGVGTQLLDWLEHAMATRGLEAIELSTVPPDHEAQFADTYAFYERRGYEVVQRDNHFYAFRRPRILMRKALAPA